MTRSRSIPNPPPPEAEDPQARIERQEFQKGHVPEGTPPVEPRAAATVVVARPFESTYEVLLLERPQASRFAAGAFVFPGGAVDDDDAATVWQNLLPRTGEPAALAAALRELFEETGILPGVTLTDEMKGAREDLLAEQVLFTELAARFNLDFSAETVAYFSRWITPRTLATRFDTRFFFLSLADRDVSVSITREHDSALWETPTRALQRFAAGELPMLFPTRKTLERLSMFDELGSALRALTEIPVEPILAKLDLRGDRIRPLMPGDAGYEETY